MRASDIVKQLARVLPKYADDFTDNFDIVSIARQGTTATATTAEPHNLEQGKQVNIKGAQNPIAFSLVRSGIEATLTTSQDHDFTENAGMSVIIDEASDPVLNSTFELLRVPNRRTLKIKVADAGPVSAAGLILNGSNYFNSFGGLVMVTGVPSETSFEYTVRDTLYTESRGQAVACSEPRVTAAIDIEKMIAAYTKQAQKSAWLFVVLGNAIASKSRGIDIDATDNIQRGNYFNQRLIQDVNIYVIYPTSQEIAGRTARDRCEELLNPICKSVLGAKFPSLVESSNNPLMITGHGAQDYSNAYYVHNYAFETTLQLGPSDIYVPEEDVAFRDITLQNSFNTGSGVMLTDIDLDDQPL